VALVRTDISEELSVSFIRVTRIGELGKSLVLTNNRRTLRDYEQCHLLGCYAVWFLLRTDYFLSVLRFLVTVKVIPNSLILVTLIMEGIRSSETLVLTRATRRHIPEDGILHFRYYYCYCYYSF
jgi:hypothetical protein